jgi:5-amino-6-(5-phosphoribosylamino)uracil reductase
LLFPDAIRSKRKMPLPHVTVVLAMSADGKIADYGRSPARFGSAADKSHLETQLAQADAFLFGAGTLRAYGTSLPITQPALLQQRQAQGLSLQPIHLVCSASGQLDRTLPFFSQAIPRWLLTTAAGATPWQGQPEFERVLIVPASSAHSNSGHQNRDRPFDLRKALEQIGDLGIHTLVVGGGGSLIADLLRNHLVQELWLTLCPLILGGSTAPSPVDGPGWLADEAPQLELVSTEAIAQEVFLHYRVRSP